MGQSEEYTGYPVRKDPAAAESDRAVPFHHVLEAELDEISASRNLRGSRRRIPESDAKRVNGGDGPERDEQLLAAALKRAQRSGLFGVCFSGGGIRSATFNLGVLQGLAACRLLTRIDLLSTVSGGGYIGSWLLAWLHRLSESPEPTGNSVQEAQSLLSPHQQHSVRDIEAEPVQRLRDYTNYLTPRVGSFSLDLWTDLALVARNLTLNLLALTLALLVLVSFPVILFEGFKIVAGFEGDLKTDPRIQLSAATIAFLLQVSMTLVTRNVAKGQGHRSDGSTRWVARPESIRLLIVVPLLCAAFIASARLYGRNPPPADEYISWMFWGAVILLWLWGSAWILGLGISIVARQCRALARLARSAFAIFRSPRRRANAVESYGLDAEASHDSADEEPSRPSIGEWIRRKEIRKWIKQDVVEIKSDVRPLLSRSTLGGTAIAVLVAGSVGGVLYFLLARLLAQDGGGWAPATAFVVGPLLTVLMWVLTTGLGVGFVGKQYSEGTREWFSRLNGDLVRLALLLTIFTGLATPEFWAVVSARPWVSTIQWEGLREYAPTIATAAWALVSALGILLGRRANTGVSTRWLVSVSPYVFIVGLILLVAWMFKDLTDWSMDNVMHQKASRIVVEAAIATTCGVLALLLSWRLGANTFSLHALYRNRLIRAYLGASNASRSEHPFTGFDELDDAVDISKLLVGSRGKENGDGGGPRNPYVGPYPIINSTLNLLAGRRLAWQHRKSVPFTISPLYSGYHYDATKEAQGGSQSAALEKHAYRDSRRFGKRLSLGTAMAISGAAASPGMGQLSSPALSFLLTVFNVRLGWWLGNPRHKTAWKRSGPIFGLFLLLSELFGRSDDRRRYVYLSDGGHFENLGLYELVRRRCRYILAVDAGADEKQQFSDLGNAIERCRTDLGVSIEVEIDDLLTSAESGFSKAHCAVGRIRYDKRDPDAQHGILLYIKPTLTGDEPNDVLRYKRLHPAFPHHSTLNQWFDETRFESYRELGYHCTRAVLRDVVEDHNAKTPMIGSIFRALENTWLPNKLLIEGALATHGAEFSRIIDRIRSEKNLAFLDAQLFPDWRSPADTDGPDPLGLPEDPDSRRDGFYTCQELIYLMESAYIHLRLEEEHAHPDNRGWMNLFRHLTWSSMMRVTWAARANTFGTRFQEFCLKHLGMERGRVKVEFIDVPRVPRQQKPGNSLSRVHEQVRVRLNRIEQLVLESLLDQVPGECQLVLLQLAVRHANPKEPKDLEVLRFVFGFALVQSDKVRYFRVRQHLREGGLGRLAVQALLRRRPGLVLDENVLWPDPARERADLRLLSRLKRLFSTLSLEIEDEDAE